MQSMNGDVSAEGWRLAKRVSVCFVNALKCICVFLR